MEIFNVKMLKSLQWEKDGEIVELDVYEPTSKGDVVKVVTDNNKLGIKAEYVFIANKYPEYEFKKQVLTSIILNGAEVKCDILTISRGKKKKYIYFDISTFMTDIYFKLKLSNYLQWEKDGKVVELIIYEPDDKGDIVKIITDDYDLGIDAECAFMMNKYPEYKPETCALGSMILNWSQCEEIENERKVYFRTRALKLADTDPEGKSSYKEMEIGRPFLPFLSELGLNATANQTQVYSHIVTISNGTDKKRIFFDISSFFSLKNGNR